jgi:hypothetical protein
MGKEPFSETLIFITDVAEKPRYSLSPRKLQMLHELSTADTGVETRR